MQMNKTKCGFMANNYFVSFYRVKNWINKIIQYRCGYMYSFPKRTFADFSKFSKKK